jgi:hypothetical protein
MVCYGDNFTSALLPYYKSHVNIIRLVVINVDQRKFGTNYRVK